MVKVTVSGVDYSAEYSRDPSISVTYVSVYANNRWATTGKLTSDLKLIDCDAPLGEEVYEALEEAIAASFARGVGAEFDPGVR